MGMLNRASPSVRPRNHTGRCNGMEPRDHIPQGSVGSGVGSKRRRRETLWPLLPGARGCGGMKEPDSGGRTRGISGPEQVKDSTCGKPWVATAVRRIRGRSGLPPHQSIDPTPEAPPYPVWGPHSTVIATLWLTRFYENGSQEVRDVLRPKTFSR